MHANSRVLTNLQYIYSIDSIYMKKWCYREQIKVLNWTLAACMLNDNGNSRANPRPDAGLNLTMPVLNASSFA